LTEAIPGGKARDGMKTYHTTPYSPAIVRDGFKDGVGYWARPGPSGRFLFVAGSNAGRA
jgi:hypothetical protein